MTSPEIIHQVFNQELYDHTFYYCDHNHPFIAFTTCYCPVCEATIEINELGDEALELEEALDNVSEMLQDLTVKVKNHSPELLI